MRKHVLVLTTSAAILACGAFAASAQAPSPLAPNAQQTPDLQTTPGGPMVQQRGQEQPQPGEQGLENQQGGDHGGRMMGGGMMGHGMMGQGYRLRSRMAGGMMHLAMLRMMFSLMDADGDGTISMQEWQAAQERIFKAMEANKDGAVTLNELQDYFVGSPASRQ